MPNLIENEDVLEIAEATQRLINEGHVEVAETVIRDGAVAIGILMFLAWMLFT